MKKEANDSIKMSICRYKCIKVSKWCMTIVYIAFIYILFCGELLLISLIAFQSFMKLILDFRNIVYSIFGLSSCDSKFYLLF